MWNEPASTRVVWFTMLAMADETGMVKASRSGLFRASNITQEEFNKAIVSIEGPDVDSRTPDFDGRRAEKVDGGWVLLNYLKYREREDKDSHREYMRKWRANKVCELTVNHGESRELTVESPSASASSSLDESAKSKASSVPKKGPSTKAPWRTDFAIYKAYAEAAFDALYEDWEWISDKKQFYPGMSIRLSLDKMWSEYWGTEAGWKKKKASKSDTIDWKRTIENGLSMACNRVWLPKGEMDCEKIEAREMSTNENKTK
jgi:hypothetical protein